MESNRKWEEIDEYQYNKLDDQVYQIKDDFLPHDEWKRIHDVMMSEDFTWNYNCNNYGATDGQYPQLTHMFYFPNSGPVSTFSSLLTPLINQLDPLALIRIKANMNWKVDEAIQRPFHVDFGGIDCTTSIYYINTNNGYTLLDDGTKIESVANRLLRFDSQIKHAAVPATDVTRRVLININYHKKESCKTLVRSTRGIDNT